MADERWTDLGPAGSFEEGTVRVATAGTVRLAVSCREGEFGALSNACNHVGGPLGQGRLDGEYLVCP